MLPILSAVKIRPKLGGALPLGRLTIPKPYCSIGLPKHDRLPPARTGVGMTHRKQCILKIYGITRKEQLTVSSWARPLHTNMTYSLYNSVIGHQPPPNVYRLHFLLQITVIDAGHFN